MISSFLGAFALRAPRALPVSYTHLDVYKRQVEYAETATLWTVLRVLAHTLRRLAGGA